MDEESDEALMARIAGGDDGAFRVLARRHLPAVVGLARHILGNAADAEDVAQDAMLRVWTNAPRWRPIAPFRGWLVRVAVNLCIDRKRRVPFVDLEVAGQIIDPAPDPATRHESKETAREISAAIARLPERQRTAVVLTYQQGLSNAQTADMLDTSVSAVETLLARAKESLRRSLRPQRDGE